MWYREKSYVGQSIEDNCGNVMERQARGGRTVSRTW